MILRHPLVNIEQRRGYMYQKDICIKILSLFTNTLCLLCQYILISRVYIYYSLISIPYLLHIFIQSLYHIYYTYLLQPHLYTIFTTHICCYNMFTITIYSQCACVSMRIYCMSISSMFTTQSHLHTTFATFLSLTIWTLKIPTFTIRIYSRLSPTQ